MSCLVSLSILMRLPGSMLTLSLGSPCLSLYVAHTHTHFITHTLEWKTTERSRSSQCCNLHKVFASTSCQPSSQLQPPTPPCMHHWTSGRSTQTWQQRNLRILFPILWMNVYGHASVWRVGSVSPPTIHLSHGPTWTKDMCKALPPSYNRLIFQTHSPKSLWFS